MDTIVGTAPVLTVSGVGKTYVEPVLTGVTLDLRAGEVLALTGENGAGKSTLSKIIGGLVDPTTGSTARRTHRRAARKPRRSACAW